MLALLANHHKNKLVYTQGFRPPEGGEGLSQGYLSAGVEYHYYCKRGRRLSCVLSAKSHIIHELDTEDPTPHSAFRQCRL